MNSLTTAVACTVYALYNGWKLSLVVLSFIPFLIFASAIRMKLFTGLGASKDSEDEIVQSGKVRPNWLTTNILKNIIFFTHPTLRCRGRFFKTLSCGGGEVVFVCLLCRLFFHLGFFLTKVPGERAGHRALPLDPSLLR